MRHSLAELKGESVGAIRTFNLCKKTLQKVFPNRRNRTMIFSKPVRELARSQVEEAERTLLVDCPVNFPGKPASAPTGGIFCPLPAPRFF